MMAVSFELQYLNRNISKTFPSDLFPSSLVPQNYCRNFNFWHVKKIKQQNQVQVLLLKNIYGLDHLKWYTRR